MFEILAAAMLVAAAISVAVAFLAWDRRPLPGATGLAAFMAVTGLWALSYAMGILADDHVLSDFWYVVVHTMIIITPLTVFALAYQYKHQTETPPRWSLLLWIFPALSIVVLLTDRNHLWFSGDSGWNFRQAAANGPWFWASVVYSYAVTGAAIGLLLTASQKWGARYRTQSMALLAAFTAPFLASIISVTTVMSNYNVDLTPLATAIGGLGLTYAMFQWGLFRAAPIAREKLVELTSDGMIVVDSDGKVVDFNRAASALLDANQLCLGCPISQVLPDWSAQVSGVSEGPLEFAIKSAGPASSIKVSVTPLQVGGPSRQGSTLVVLRDISSEVAVIALEQNARRRAEAEAAFTATINQTLNRDEIVREMLATARRTTDANYALLLTVKDGESICSIAGASGTEHVFSSASSMSMVIDLNLVPTFEHLIATGEPVLVNDIMDAPDLAVPGHLLIHLRSIAAVRIDSWGGTAGILVLSSSSPSAFTQYDTTRLISLAAAATSAIRNAEQLKTIERQAAQSEVERGKLRSILDALLDPLAVFEPIFSDFGDVDDFVLTDVNQLALKFQGLPVESVMGQRMSVLQPESTRNGIMAKMKWSMQSGEEFFTESFEWSPGDRSGSFIDLRAVPFANGIIVNWRDITPRARAEQELRESEQRFRLLAENSLSAVFRLSDAGTITWVSPSIQDAVGWTHSQLAGHPLSDFVHPDDTDSIAQLEPANGNARSNVTRLRVIDPKGEHHWVEILSREYTNARGEREGLIGSLRTVDDEVATERELERRARYDELTGVLNRRAVMERVVDIARRGARTGQHAAIMFCDLDKLKDTNEQYGHAGGDRLIKTVANRMVETVRQTDTVGRFGGDEFLVLLEGIHDLEGAAMVAEKVRRAVSNPISMDDGTMLDPSISIGVTLMTDGEDIDEVIERANRGLFGAKRTGRDRVVVIPVDGSQGAEGAV